ncbi:PREDICTED: rapid alkalinization factor-like [Nelumbo nucifera]|nr:PREDICTED: rapid alkalinization factor-like [Nelumbo nucifera]
MATSSGFFVMFVVFVTALLISSSTTIDASGEYQLGWLPTRSTCQGSMEECMAGGNEFEMDSEINRRILATSQYISYGALQRNTVPCSRRGASYYNCKPGAQANPYNRGCSAITRCRS